MRAGPLLSPQTVSVVPRSYSCFGLKKQTRKTNSQSSETGQQCCWCQRTPPLHSPPSSGHSAHGLAMGCPWLDSVPDKVGSLPAVRHAGGPHAGTGTPPPRGTRRTGRPLLSSASGLWCRLGGDRLARPCGSSVATDSRPTCPVADRVTLAPRAPSWISRLGSPGSVAVSGPLFR